MSDKNIKFERSHSWRLHPIENIMDWFRHMRWYYQRAVYGYSDCDRWGLFSYVSHIIEHMTAELAEKASGYPGTGWEEPFDPDNPANTVLHVPFSPGGPTAEEVYSLEEWQVILRTISAGFAAASRLLTLDEEPDDAELFEHGMELFKEWFFSLWD